MDERTSALPCHVSATIDGASPRKEHPVRKPVRCSMLTPYESTNQFTHSVVLISG